MTTRAFQKVYTKIDNITKATVTLHASGVGNDELATVLEGRLRSEILGYPNVKIRVFVPPVALHPSLYGAAEMGLRRFIENPLGYMGEK